MNAKELIREDLELKTRVINILMIIFIWMKRRIIWKDW